VFCACCYSVLSATAGSFLAAAREGGATRLSLGVQSFHGPSRRAVRRVGSQRDNDEILLFKRLSLAAEYFPAAFSADLISGLPLQDEAILLDDIRALLIYKPAHISLYALTIEPGKLKSARDLLPPADEADSLWLCGRDALEKSGYGQYEVSNFCQPGRESSAHQCSAHQCRHNIRYWRMLNWLALGPSASATIINDETGTGFRYTIQRRINNHGVPRSYSENIHFSSTKLRVLCGKHEELDSRTLMKESFLMGFRYIEGPDEDLFRRRFGKSIGECIPKTIEKWRVRFQKDKFALTKDGLLLLDPFLIEAFEELEL